MVTPPPLTIAFTFRRPNLALKSVPMLDEERGTVPLGGKKHVSFLFVVMALLIETPLCHEHNGDEGLRAASKVGGNQQNLMDRLLPLMIVPFLISSALIPIMLASIKVLFIKSVFVGAIAIVLMLVNFLRRRTDGGGVFNHYVQNDLAETHYGYKGVEEPGIYLHKRKRRRRK
ncbi:hypothetical protein ABEB36_012543 [Hypothenemus hampei]|uniref:Uncharacterized protein n=1 Tax=Hypothenemus hampei TaxID=57062 RepID=A0ABD1EFW6_HYPHA